MTKDDSLDIFFVPFPRDSQADEYYYSMSAFGYLVPAGSKLAEQASVFINCCRLSTTDEDLKATTKASIMKNKKYTDEQYDFLYSFKEINNFHAVVDEPYGLDETTGRDNQGYSRQHSCSIFRAKHTQVSLGHRCAKLISVQSTSRLNTTTVLSQAVTHP